MLYGTVCRATGPFAFFCRDLPGFASLFREALSKVHTQTLLICSGYKGDMKGIRRGAGYTQQVPCSVFRVPCSLLFPPLNAPGIPSNPVPPHTEGSALGRC